MSITIKVNCEWCKREFEVKKKRFNENQRKKYKHFCCIEHQAKYKSWKRSDEYTFYRLHIRRIKHRSAKKNWETDLTIYDLHAIMKEQDQKCPYTGQTMLLIGKNHPYQASLDRKDSNLPYIKGNVEFISLIGQYAKNVFSSNDLIQFVKDTYEYRIKTSN